jgi:hypothetical protein
LAGSLCGSGNYFIASGAVINSKVSASHGYSGARQRKMACTALDAISKANIGSLVSASKSPVIKNLRW